jgi:hypothetical protein
MAEEKTLTLTASQLQQMLVEMAKEIRRPADPTPKELKELENDAKMRRDQAELVRQQMANRAWQKKTCSHTRTNGTTCAVFVGSLGVMICQHCQALIYPSDAPKYVEDGIYDTGLFNRLFQLEAEQSQGMSFYWTTRSP